MNNKEIIQYALGNIQKDGTIHLEWKELNNDNSIAGTLSVKLNYHTIELYAAIKKELRTLHFDKIEELALTRTPFIIVAERIFPKIKEELCKETLPT